MMIAKSTDKKETMKTLELNETETAILLEMVKLFGQSEEYNLLEKSFTQGFDENPIVKALVYYKDNPQLMPAGKENELKDALEKMEAQRKSLFSGLDGLVNKIQNLNGN